MKKDIGFWNNNGEYVEDIQEVDEREMDKEIIIDGINVAGCDWYFKPNGNCDNEQLVHKCEGDNCYYKQLKRAEYQIAEDEDLQCDMRETIEQLKAENERILEQKNNVMRKNIVLYTTLQEIKEIAEKSYKTSLIEKDCIACDDYLAQILQKIAKAEEE